jgi:integral membrane protein
LFNSTIKRLRVIALIEGVSLLVILFITMPLKYLMEMPQPNYVIGMMHGVFFILYVALVIQAESIFKWGSKNTLLALAASVIPFGTFWADKKIFKVVA